MTQKSALLLLFLAVLLRWPSLDLPIDNDTGARAYHARLILEGEPLYSSHHPGHHLPGIYYTYAAALKLFGDRGWSILYMLILWTMLVTAILYRLGKSVAGERVGQLTVVFYAVFSAHVWLWGQTAETELFANLWRSAAVLMLVWLWKRRWEREQLFFFVGILGAFSFMYKAVYLSPLMLSGIMIMVRGWRNQDFNGAIRRGLWIVAGVLSVVIPVVIYFASQGLLPRFFHLFVLGQSHISNNNFISGNPSSWLLYPLLPLYGLAYNNAILLIFSLVAALFILIRPQNRRSSLLWLVIWYVLTFLEAGINLELFAHYYLLIVPPLAILAAWLVWQISQLIHRSQLQWMLMGLLVLVGLSLSVWQNGEYYKSNILYRRDQKTLAEFVTVGWPNFGTRLVRSVALAEIVKARTNEDDLIYYWSEDVQLYYNSRRRAPIDLIWPRVIDRVEQRERIWESSAELIIIDRTRVPGPADWLEQAISDLYQLETVWDDQEIYRSK